MSYHYRLVAWNEDGTSYGQDKTFTTEAGLAPLASTGAASGVSVNEATISGTINPQGKETSYRFEYGDDTEYGTQAFGTVLPEQGEQTVTLNLRGLDPNTTYHYRLVVSNPGGTAYGEDMTFTTPPIADPLVNPATAPLIALPNIAFPTETANTQSPTIAVVSHSVEGHTVSIKVSVPSAGKLVATGKAVSKGTVEASKAEDVTVKVSLTKAEAALLAKHKGRTPSRLRDSIIRVKINLTFTPTKGTKLSTSVTVAFS